MTEQTESSRAFQNGRRRIVILVADDNPINQIIALHLLQRRGFQVELACNGKDAVDKFSRRRFDAVLMDVQMPLMDGLEATAAIRRIEQPDGRRVPIVAVTAYAMRGDRERCLAAGMDEYISKPVQSAELLAILDQALTRA